MKAFKFIWCLKYNNNMPWPLFSYPIKTLTDVSTRKNTKCFSTIFYRTDCKQCKYFFFHWLISETGKLCRDGVSWYVTLCTASLPSSEVPAWFGPWAVLCEQTLALCWAPPWHWEGLKPQILIHFCPFTQLALSPRPQEHLISLGPLSPSQDGTKEHVQTEITSISCAHH